MISTIIHGATKSARAKKVSSLVGNSSLIHLYPEPLSIGIASIKNLVNQLSISSASSRVVWIEEASALTADASGALLKVLEEPPSNTTIYLTTHSALSLLSTIRSRCNQLSLTNVPTSQDLTNLTLIKPLLNISPADRLSELVNLPKTKADLSIFLESLASEIYQTMTKTTSLPSQKFLAQLSTLVLKVHNGVSHNISPSLALTYLLLHLPKTKN